VLKEENLARGKKKKATQVPDYSWSCFCLPCAKRPVHKWSAGGLNFHFPLCRCSTSSIGNIQSKRALGGVRWRVFVACYMACIRSTLLMIIPEEPEYMLLWLSDCEWNQLDGRVIGLDLIIGDFGEM